VALHPSGRLALSVGKDRTIRLWNLLKGRSAYVKTLPGEAHRVVWSPQGTRYAVATDKSAIAYSLEVGRVWFGFFYFWGAGALVCMRVG
jgi:protein MAK11